MRDTAGPQYKPRRFFNCVRVVAGELDAQELALLSSWIELNREVLIAYWNGSIDTQDALDALQRI